ncbi:pyridoxamine 5'-phosphate oxidase family protein [Paracoccaceae bacterium GXU_MW_L88]
MATQYDSLNETYINWIAKQHIFFTATATADSRVNMSPREASAFRVIGPNRVLYLDYTGSGSETAAHLKVDGRMTIMFCAFDTPPLILRLYGTARSLNWDDPAFETAFAEHFPNAQRIGTRQIVTLDIDLVQKSCGYGVPFFDFAGERDLLRTHMAGKGEDGVRKYWREKNALSIDGLPTGIVEPE